MKPYLALSSLYNAFITWKIIIHRLKIANILRKAEDFWIKDHQRNKPNVHVCLYQGLWTNLVLSCQTCLDPARHFMFYIILLVWLKTWFQHSYMKYFRTKGFQFHLKSFFVFFLQFIYSIINSGLILLKGIIHCRRDR